MIRALVLAMNAFCLTLAIMLLPTEPKYPCARVLALQKWAADHHYAVFEYVKKYDGTAKVRYKNKKTTEWLEIGVDGDLNACVLDRGPASEWALNITPM